MAQQHSACARAARAFAWAVAAAVTLAGGSAHAAEPYPTAAVRIVVPWNTGGPNDLLARALAAKMAEALRTSFVIENRPGANGATGTLSVARAPADGYTMLITSSAHTLNVGMYKSLGYDPIKDFAPITLFALTRGAVLTVRSDFPANTLAEFIAYAKAQPDGIAIANNGVGNATHIASELLAQAAGIKVVHVPYRGTAPFVTDLMGGHIKAGIMATVAAIPLVRDRKLKALAVLGHERTPSLPDVPTAGETGHGAEWAESYFGAWFPAQTPRERVDTMHRAFAAALQTPELVKLLRDSDLIPKGAPPEEFERFLIADVPRVLKIFQRAGIQPQ